MRILLLNWRDIKHPRKGGAEVLTHGVFRRLVERGHSVTWFGSAFAGGAEREVIDGVNIVRGGNAVTVRAHAYRYYHSDPQFDAVVDEINTLPFFAPLYANSRAVAFVCQLAREVWFYEAPPLVARIGYTIEPLYLRPYRAVPTMTISDSSAQSLREEAGFRGPIGVMPMAIDQYAAEAPLPLALRDDTIVALGRVTPSKRLDQSIRALALLRDSPFDRLQLLVVGDGAQSVRDELTALARELGVEHRVSWTGFVNEDRKRELLRRAKILIMTSVREGWGLAVSEANLAGVPAIGYDIPGLRDSIKNRETGLVIEESPEALAEGVRKLLNDGDGYMRVASAAQRDAATLTWDATTSFVDSFLTSIVKGR